MMDMKLLNLLQCPDCSSDLLYRKHDTKEELICSKCQRIFEVADGVPLMLPKEQS